MYQHDRATGWQYAKLSGHENENRVKKLLDRDMQFAKKLLQRLEIECNILNTSIGGIHETNVSGVTGRKTKSKTDLKLYLDSGKTINISIKKSMSGQVYYVKAVSFIEVFEKQFNKHIPESVKRAIKLFWSEADDAVEIIENFGSRVDEKNFNRQIRRRSVNSVTLRNYDEALFFGLIKWFAENAFEITKLTFAMGGVSDKREWAEYVWYINLLNENNADEIFKISDICVMAQNNARQETYFGTKNGGTTIQLPFGFVEWHHGRLQFHSDCEKIKRLLDKDD